MKKIILLTAIIAALFVAKTNIVFAEEQEQTADDIEQYAECDQVVTGAYGENTCIINQDQHIEQKQEQHITYVEAEETQTKEHKPVDAALDFKSSAAAVSTIMAGAAAFVVKLKSRLA